MIVENIFSLAWGLTIFGRKNNEFVDFKVGSSIEIENNNGKVIPAKIISIPLIPRKYSDENYFADKENFVSFSVETNIKKNQISKGAIIWLPFSDENR